MTKVSFDNLGAGVAATIALTLLIVLATPVAPSDAPALMAAGLLLVMVRSAAVAALHAPPTMARRISAQDRRRRSAPGAARRASSQPASAQQSSGPDAATKMLEAPAEAGDKLSVKTFTTAKLGASADENEDAMAVGNGGHLLAVADGASSAYASRHWSRLLVDRFVSNWPVPLEAGRTTFVEACAEEWEVATTPQSDSDWWNVEAQRRGSFATFVGVTIAEDCRWEAFVVGDCCVMVVKAAGELLSSFPIDEPEGFTSTPSALATSDPSSGGWQHTAGRLAPGDVLVAASDGVAEWVLGDPAERVQWLRQNEASKIEALLNDVRASGDLVNDDMTFVVVEYSSNGDA